MSVIEGCMINCILLINDFRIAGFRVSFYWETILKIVPSLGMTFQF